MENEDMFVLSGGGKNLVKVKKKDLESYTIPNSVTAIGKRAFKGCTSLQEVYIPGNVKNIGMEAFMDCTSLFVLKISDGVTAIGKGAFRNCTSLREVYLPASLREIGNDAFMNCPSLRSIKIPEGVSRIGRSCFSDCKSLEEIFLPDDLKEMSEGTFRGCSSLKEIVIPQNVISINKECFSGCISLEKVKMLNNKTSVDETSFSRCYNVYLDLEPVEFVTGVKSYNYSMFKDWYYTDNMPIEKIIDKLEFKVPTISKAILIQLACNSLNISSPREISIRSLGINCLNYLRHEQTQYERIWEYIKWILWEEHWLEKEAYYNQLLKTKVNRIICNSYPWIAEYIDAEL